MKKAICLFAGVMIWTLGFITDEVIASENCSYLFVTSELVPNAVKIIDVVGDSLVGFINHPDFGSGGSGRNMTFRQDGHLFVTNDIGSDPHIYEFDENGNYVRRFSVPGVPRPGSITFAPNGHLFVNYEGVSAFGASITEYNLNTETVVHSMLMCPGRMEPANLRFGPNGHLFVAGWGDCDPTGGGFAWIEEWDVSAIPWVKIKEYHGTNSLSRDRWNSVVFIGDDTMLAGNYHPLDTSRIEIFDIPTGAYLGSLVRLAGSHFVGLTIGPDRLLYTARGVDFQVTKYDPHTGQFLGKVCDGCASVAGDNEVAFSPGFLCPLEVKVDIKPQSCPNPLNVADMGVLPVAILGTSDFDVSQVDPASLRLEGIAPVRWTMEDVSTPVPDSDDSCFCHTLGPDGFVDLVLHFPAQEIVSALGSYSNWETRALTLTGELFDGTPIEGEDCIRIQIPPKKRYWGGMFGKGEGPQNAGYGPSTFELLGNYPNPFNATTTISYSLPQDAEVRLDIYNVAGQKVRTLIEENQSAGIHSLVWDGRNDSGQPVASGLYFYRLKAGEFLETRRMTLLK